ncbi:MAG: hypothetical protein IJW68_08735 [Bacteroidaceae bacterium]|nr:hypothetical protein [Bacteroidaceae bacterium]
MKKFIFKIIIIFTIVAIFDYFFGVVMGHVVNNINVGGQGRDNYICNVAEEDILVFGSSRAVHHYNSTILEDSLGMSCYNCGEEANGFILSYGRLLMALERHCPKVIIQDITAEFDLHKNDNHKYLGWLKTRYERAGVSEIFDAIDKTESYKMKSQMYRYNSKFLQNIFVYLTSVSTDMGIKGYRPINEPFDSMKIVKTEKPDDKEIDSLKIEFIHRYLELAQNSKIYFVVSPIWYGMDSEEIAPIAQICKERNIPLFDFSNNPKYVHNDEYFKDGTHLNAFGADEFTKDLIKEIKSLQ